MADSLGSLGWMVQCPRCGEWVDIPPDAEEGLCDCGELVSPPEEE